MNRLAGSYSALVLILCLSITGCARSLVGSPIDSSLTGGIEVGKTTRSEVLRTFGSPFRIESLEGQEILTYLYGEETVIWYVFYTERRQRADILTVFIGPDGIVSDYSFSRRGAIPDFYRTRPTPY